MATSVAAQGRVAVKGRLRESIPEGWAVDEYGDVTTDTERVLAGLPQGLAALLPLGGQGETLGGHKGFGLALAVDILSGILTGAGYADKTCPTTEDGERLAGNIGHLFMAFDIATFRDIDSFKSDMDDLLRRVKSSKKVPGEQRIFIHGEKERETRERRLKEGIPLHPSVVRDLEEITSSLGLPSLAHRFGGTAPRDR
jgi:LDH2 family malate/lactate/ureidoglycolate dehydrogenase